MEGACVPCSLGSHARIHQTQLVRGCPLLRMHLGLDAVNRVV